MQDGEDGQPVPTDLRVPYAWAVYGDEERRAVSDFIGSHRVLSGGEFTKLFESEVARLFGKRHGVMVNSGSSANLVATELLELRKGSEVITPILTFSTTLAPLLQKGLTPVFVDVDVGSYQIRVDQVEAAIRSPTRALAVPSLLGNLPDMRGLMEISERRDLFYVEDSCDTIGSRYDGKPTGFYSDISTTSFYGSHIVTAAGGGGMVTLDDEAWQRRAKVLRGWGRSSSVNESEDISVRFGYQLNGASYDSKFVFEEIGYNFWPLEVSSVFGLEQLRKLPDFLRRRRANFERLTRFFSSYEDVFILPKQLSRAETSWLAYPLTIKESAPFSRRDITVFLEGNNVQTRPIFTGNVLRQPGFSRIAHRDSAESYPNADLIMRGGFLIGCHQGLEEPHMEKLQRLFTGFLSRFK